MSLDIGLIGSAWILNRALKSQIWPWGIPLSWGVLLAFVISTLVILLGLETYQSETINTNNIQPSELDWN
jgi:hypothetical protein